MSYDFCIVGAGFTGAVLAERIASVLNRKVLLIDSRSHIGGNAYDELDESGILVHRYGPHIFHTNSTEVWNYLSQFTKWLSYSHKVLGYIDGKMAPIPFNLNSLHILFPEDEADRLEGKLVSLFGMDRKVPVLDLRKNEDREIRDLGEYIYEKVFLHYTVKQWGMKPDDLSPAVTGRVPVFISRDDRYFQDTYQGMPQEGYTPLFQKMLSHPNIDLMLSTTYQDVAKSLEYKTLIYTGPIDEYFNYQFGPLVYRSLDFEFENHPREYYQDAGTVNYPNDFDFTRITEFKRLTAQKDPSTTIMKEFSRQHEVGKTIPYYPIPKIDCIALYQKYEAEASKLPNVCFAGRLGTYCYINMDTSVERALRLFETFSK